MLHGINSLLLTLQRTSFGTGVHSQRVKMEEGEVKLNLNVLDLPGFGDEIDNSRWLNDLRRKHNPYEQVLASTG